MPVLRKSENMRNFKKVRIAVSKKAVHHNYRELRKYITPKTMIWSVVKSNAYGHGLLAFSKLAEGLGVDGFCVDSVIEGLKLRENGLLKPVLVLGPTLSALDIKEASACNISITISNNEGLKLLKTVSKPPKFHLKIDTGMHRQGFYIEELPTVFQTIKKAKLPLTGIYTHFASAKDLNYPTFTDFQFHAFKQALEIAKQHGFKNIIRHAAATGGTLVNKEYHLDAVRIGIGLYGHWPSREIGLQLRDKISLQSALSWHSMVSEIKTIKAGEYIGYDLVERVYKNTNMAIIPIGYWHGFDWRLSGVGEVLISGKRARILGRVSMDLITVDVTGINCHVGSDVVLIGTQGKEEITVEHIASKLGTSYYETLTCINPLTQRIVV